MIQKPLRSKLLYLSFFGISMAYLESAIVVYLRELYYPDGFAFPLKDIPVHILITEIGREAATILLLFSVAKLVSRNRRETFAYFSISFGIWDIWYYLWLKLLINWPMSLSDWDVLFLIPLPWFGPVLAPVLVSCGLILAGYIILDREHAGKPLHLSAFDWGFEIFAGLIIIGSFLTETLKFGEEFVPDVYPWWMFSIGFVAGLILFLYRAQQK
jgi:hypothetical protein